MNTTPIPGFDTVSLAHPTDFCHLGSHGHVVQFYGEDGFLLDGLSRFVGSALGAGDAAIVIATKAHEQGLAQRLKAHGLDITSAVYQGRYVSLDAAETLSKFMLNAWPDAARFTDYVGGIIARATAAAKGERARVAAFGEMVALLWADGKPDAAIRLEQLWNELAQTHSFYLHCAYPISGFYREGHGEPIQKICAEHSRVLPAESYMSLVGEEERLRSIILLQQKAQALETEVLERQKVEEALRASEGALRKSHGELEKRVEQRTRELFQLTCRLRAEVEQRTEAEARLRELSGRLLSLRDEERRKLARDLHDSTGQLFVALQLNLAFLQKSASKLEPALSQRIAESINIADQAMQEIRTMSYLLYPPMLDEVGLLFAIHWYVEGFVERSNIQVDLDLPEELGRLPQDLETTVFRIVQEALTNVHRHSGSSIAKVQLTIAPGGIHLVIQDQGKGISLDKVEGTPNGTKIGVGIRGMRERVRQFGGVLRIGPANPGTCVEAILPVSFSSHA